MSFQLNDVRALVQLARTAGQIILRIRDEHRANQNDLGKSDKNDGSPVTRADTAAEEHILEGIENLGLMQPVVAEESAATLDVSQLSGYYLIDPLDGTKAFVDGGDDFTVNIGFIQKGYPVMGVLHVPCINETYYTEGHRAYHLSAGEYESIITARTVDDKAVDVIVNRTEDWSGRLRTFLEPYAVRETQRLSSAHKLGLIAHGKFDLYPRFGPTCEWDIASGDAILRAAGGSVKTLDGLDMTYGKPKFLNPHFVARGRVRSEG
jgi:3'(2'), 5'-bisphosphate nucleotidase